MRKDLTPPPRAGRVGTRRAVERTLAAWSRSGYLAGDEHAGRRRLLRELADVADQAEADHLAGQLSGFSRSRVLAELAGLLDRWAPAAEPPDPEQDPFVVALAEWRDPR